MKQLKQAQVILEFCFSMIALVILIMGMLKVFAWTGKDMVARRLQHEQVLYQPVGGEWDGPLKQTAPLFFSASKIDAAVNSSVFGDANP